VVILSAHLDSTSIQSDYTQAPGAEDNASGSAALLEAARLLRDFRFERSLQIIWFTGEEQGLYGSSYFITHLPAGKTYAGVVNLDMFGYDSDDDRCFELHVGTLPASEAVGQCFTGTIQANGLPLNYDYLTSQAEGYSDHEPFWRIGIGAVEVLENHSTLTSQGGCIGADRNPYYHTVNDRIAQMNLAAGADIARAGVATAVNLAGPTGVCGGGPALALSAGRSASQAQLTWSALQGAAGYRIWRSTQGCGGPWEQVGETSTPGQPWLDALPATNQAYVYQVQALGVEGCALSTCAPAHWPDRWYLPRISR
jgi:leucyl aminopeptidase